MAENEEEEHQSVVDRALSAEMQDSYMQYAMSVIKSRALPDVRDGMKPSQRRVIYAMAHNLSLLPSKQRVKSARTASARRSARISLRSWPAQKALPRPPSTTTRAR